MKSRAGKIGILGCIGGVVFLWMGCAGAARVKLEDMHCRMGVYDRVSCNERPDGLKPDYLKSCATPPPGGNDDPGPEALRCDGYLCLEKLCRSCRSNAECEAVFGAGQQCSIVTGPNTMPGAVCWPRAAPLATYGSERTDPRDVCVANPNDAPDRQRLAGGHACSRDCDCLSSLCDRGICADIADLANPAVETYGRGPCEQGRLPGLEDKYYERIPPDFCGGYVCVEQRCRSCRSDVECRDGLLKSRCLSFPGLPGKQCEDPDERNLRPGAPRPMPTPQGYLRDQVLSVAPRIDPQSNPREWVAPKYDPHR